MKSGVVGGEPSLAVVSAGTSAVGVARGSGAVMAAPRSLVPVPGHRVSAGDGGGVAGIRRVAAPKVVMGEVDYERAVVERAEAQRVRQAQLDGTIRNRLGQDAGYVAHMQAAMDGLVESGMVEGRELSEYLGEQFQMARLRRASRPSV